MLDSNDVQRWPNLGDIPAEEFRETLHRVADWVADYRESIEELKISPDIALGEISARLPQVPPEAPARFSDIFRDFKNRSFLASCTGDILRSSAISAGRQRLREFWAKC